jgi:hypothetical protein
MIHQQWQQYLETAAPGGESAAAGLAYVPDLAAVRFQGSNARSFLQGYLTSDTTRLREGTLLPTALCNLKGRVVMNGWCAPENDQDVLLVLHASLVDALSAFLKPYLMFSRHTSLTDLRDDLVLLTSLDLPEDVPEDVSDPAIEGGLVLDARRRLFPVSALAEAQRLWESHSHVGAEAWLAALTADGIPLVTAPVSETFLPQMLNLETLGAIDFEKGCYLGQEVVARAQHRGEVKRRLTSLTWHGRRPPDPGGDVTDLDGKVHGVVLQSAADGAGCGPLLAVLRQGAPKALWQGDTNLRPAP